MRVISALVSALTVVAVIAGGCAALRSAGTKAGVSPKAFDAAEGVGDDIKALASDMSLEDERDLGESVALQAYATPEFGKPVRDGRVMRYANTLAAVVGRYSDRPLIPYFVVVIDSDKINAFATPGGYIFITKGAVKAMKSEAEFACVIGHEIAHVTERHAVSTIKWSRALNSPGKALTTATDNKLIAEFSKTVKGMTNRLITKAFSEDEELDADVKGVSFACAAGYDPRAMLEFVDTVAAATAKVEGAAGTHPSKDERRGAIQDFCNEVGDFDGLVKGTARFKSFQKNLDAPQGRW